MDIEDVDRFLRQAVLADPLSPKSVAIPRETRPAFDAGRAVAER